ncbi:MAG: deoxyribose-phosphate aldolase [Chloroflexi bacterium]|nr:deoxyribose-phosphate aldolase [Chloroflexota bacterium]
MSSRQINIAKYIDHTILRPEATEDDVRKVCWEAKEHGFAAVVVQPFWVRLASACVADSGVKVCTVSGFPFGASTSSVKGLEARLAAEDGAHEVDMVLNLGAFKSGQIHATRNDIAHVVKQAHQISSATIVKVIIECNLLTDEEKVRAARLVEEAGAQFVKTNTGYSGGGATVEDVRLLRSAVSPNVKIKASGGIRTYEQTIALVEAGADRIGTSTGVAIVRGVPQS